ncbi:MAG: mannose-1-phosphate guanylyltransferase/mannose-6-phosphate isomerase [Thermosulfidibacteraceae bacterium]|jgi:mannose-1-phosphate guanylyltransferase/mannose-6-phosphate isomerase
MKKVILAGGSGTRLWPLSRKNYPKQFVKLNNGFSFFQETVKRLLGLGKIEDLVVVASKDYRFLIEDDLRALFNDDRYSFSGNIVIEPEAKNTAFAISWAIRYGMEFLGWGKGDVVGVFPSDHVVKPFESFKSTMERAEKVAHDGYLVTIGVKPTKPETGYGYILRGEEIVPGAYNVCKFVEKPSIDLAIKYIGDGRYYWNAGIFIFRISTMLEEIVKFLPSYRVIFEEDWDRLVSGEYRKAESISIDYGVMEKSDKVAVIEADFLWSDIGSWDAFCEVFESDSGENVVIVDSKNVSVISSRVIGIIGLEDVVVVDTDDALLISKKGSTQAVRDIVDELKKRGFEEVTDHRTVYRPWGSFTVLEEGLGFKVKRIVVKPGGSISLQRHFHRSEHWIVVRGVAKVRIGDREFFLRENESTYVPQAVLHRLENPGKIPLEIIEIQTGSYIGEDDIERLEDIYGRC